jgi:hypothetical protein
MCCINVSVNNDVGVPWLNCRFVYSIPGQIRSLFVPSLFAVCVILVFSILVFWYFSVDM